MIGIFVAALLLQSTSPATFVSATELRQLLAVSTSARTDSLLILDARDAPAYARGHLPHAVRIDWKDYRDGWGRTGKLSPATDALARKLTALGVDTQRRVIVYGAARDGWGEEGRIAWMLDYLGHRNVQLLDGGYRAWTDAGGVTRTTREVIVRGQFVATPRLGVRATLADVAHAVGIGNDGGTNDRVRAVVLDVRPRDEWDGARRYYEPRTGHIPGAMRVDWRDFMDSAGRVRVREELLLWLAARGVRADRPVIVYCTGGVRSAMAFWMLRSLGFADVRNFDGSWYEWAFDKTKPIAVGGPDVP